MLTRCRLNYTRDPCICKEQIFLINNNLWGGIIKYEKGKMVYKMKQDIRKIAIYGKGGIGKSTTTSNLSAALAMKGYKVMQIGCDPKADSTKNLMKGERIPTVLEQIKAKGDSLKLEDIVFEGFGGVMCVESGGPTPGVGCAGRGIISAFEKLEELDAFRICQPDIVIYDVLGDVVCGGFAMPIRGGYAKEVYIVSSGEMMSVYAANNIAAAIRNFGKRGYAVLSGLILNAKNIENEEQIIQEALKEIGTTVTQYIPRSGDIQKAESRGGTVFEFLEESEMKEVYNSLAEKILNSQVCPEN